MTVLAPNSRAGNTECVEHDQVPGCKKIGKFAEISVLETGELPSNLQQPTLPSPAACRSFLRKIKMERRLHGQ